MTPFRSFFMAGFECSSHRRPDGVRLDLVRGTGHDALALADYRACAGLGLLTVRDGLRWHLIETSPGVYDWSSWLPMLEAAEETGVEVIWDAFHYGSPDHLDQGSASFVDAYARFAAAAVRVHREVTGRPAWMVPVNEISFFTWAVRTGYFPKAGPDEQGWFKRHLARAAIAGVQAMRAADPGCRFVTAEPLIHVTAREAGSRVIGSEDAAAAEQARLAQFEGTDLLLGLAEPELGGSGDLIDAVGLNFYPDNQWYLEGSTIPLGHRDYRPLADMIEEAHARYRKPLFLAETMCEGSARAAWLHYVCAEVREALRRGVPVIGLCLYPVTAFPGWDDGRPADVGLFTAPQPNGQRQVHEPLREELEHQRSLLETSAAIEARAHLKLL
jgi:hypothetical protein